jgi:hypothetical protein
LVVEHWYEYKEWGNFGEFIMFLVFLGVGLISYYLEWKWKDHPFFKTVFKGVTFRTPDSDH